MAHIKSGACNMPNQNTEEIWLELLNLKCRLAFQSEPVVLSTTTDMQIEHNNFHTEM